MNCARSFFVIIVAAANFFVPSLTASADNACGPGYHQSGTHTEKRDRDIILRPICDPDPVPASSYTAAWNASASLKEQRRVIEGFVGNIPHQAFKRWVEGNVVFDRVSRAGTPRLGVVHGKLIVYDSFWASDLSATSRMNLLVFELAKVLWYQRVNSGAREARTPNTVEFDALYYKYQADINASKFAEWRGADLGYVVDPDPQSWFAFACRAAIFNLKSPASATKEWPDSQRAVKAFVEKLLAEP